MRIGWMEIVLIVVLVIILFGHNKIPGMMKNLADGLNVFRKEIKTEKKSTTQGQKKETVKKKPVKKSGAKKK